MPTTFDRTVGVFLFVFWSLVQAPSAVGFELSDDSAWTGMSMSHDGQMIVVSKTPRDRTLSGGELSFIGFADGSTTSVPTPEGVLPHNPEFGPYGDRVLYSGLCVAGFECEADAEGWNLYIYDLRSGDTKQVTQSKPGTVRWDAAWGTDGEFYVTEFEDDGNPFARQRRIGTIINIVSTDGASTPFFPVNESLSKQSPMGQLDSVELLRALPYELHFYSHIHAKSKRPTTLFELFVEDGRVFDQRLTDFADREYFLNPPRFGGGTPNTVFTVSAEQLNYVLDRNLVREALPDVRIPESMVFGPRAADAETIWVIASTFDEFAGHTLAYRDGSVSAAAPRWFWGDGDLIEFDAAKNHAIALVKDTQDGYWIRFFQSWTLKSEIVITASE